MIVVETILHTARIDVAASSVELAGRADRARSFAAGSRAAARTAQHPETGSRRRAALARARLAGAGAARDGGALDGVAETLREQALNDLAACEVSFLVFGRVAKGRFIGLEDLTLPATLSGLCQSVPESRYRNDTSSSDIRRQSLMD